jgi:hypothetical protein
MHTLSGGLLACIKRCVKHHQKEQSQTHAKNIPPKHVKSLQQVAPKPQSAAPAQVNVIKPPFVMSQNISDGYTKHKNPQVPTQTTQPKNTQQSATLPPVTWDNNRTFKPNQYGRTFVRPFVEPNPNHKGNKVSKAFEAHFLNDCFRCGDSSHRSSDCKLYPERTAVVTVCTVCGQGLHDVCRSKRRGIKNKVKNMTQTGNFTNKQIFDMYQLIKNNVQYRSEHESDSD